MGEKIIKRAYYLPSDLVYYFKNWSKPGRNYSPSIAGAMLVWMALPPDFREFAKKLSAKTNVKQAVEQAALQLQKNMVDNEIHKFLDTLSDEQKNKFLADIKSFAKKAKKS